jgi:hypothetical protein
MIIKNYLLWLIIKLELHFHLVIKLFFRFHLTSFSAFINIFIIINRFIVNNFNFQKLNFQLFNYKFIINLINYLLDLYIYT